MTKAAVAFLQSLSPEQKAKAQFTFEDGERYNWNYVPIDRKGIPLRELSSAQREAGLNLLRIALSDSGYNKTIAITRTGKGIESGGEPRRQ